jgi:hypothetical protein
LLAFNSNLTYTRYLKKSYDDGKGQVF